MKQMLPTSAKPPVTFGAWLHAVGSSCLMLAAACLLTTATATAPAAAQSVAFPPAESKPAPRAKSPPKTETSGEDTGIIPDYGPTMRKTQSRVPPPPPTLTVMYKLVYGNTLSYTHPDGRVEEFEQWKSFQNDGFKIVQDTTARLKDGNNYVYTTKPLSSDGFDPLDIPLLYMTGDYDFTFTDTEVKHLRQYLDDGGTIFFNAARGRDEYSFAVIREMRRIYPNKRFMRMPLDHPLFNTRYRLKQVMSMTNGVQSSQPPEVYSIDIGTRASAILIPLGMGTAWSATKYHPQGKHLVGESATRLGVNLLAYVLGNTEYSRFLAQEFKTYQGQTRPGDVLRFANVKYSGSWDVNPVIQNSVLSAVNENTGIAVDFSPHPVALDDKELGNFPLLFMTGHYDFKLTEGEIAGLRDHLTRGGMLIASAAAGLRPFDTAFKREMQRVFPEGKMIRLPSTHPVYTSGWNPIEHVTYTAPALRDDPSLSQPDFEALFVDGRIVVLYSPYDIMSGVNRESNAYAKGVIPEDATRLLINAITYSLTN